MLRVDSCESVMRLRRSGVSGRDPETQQTPHIVLQVYWTAAAVDSTIGLTRLRRAHRFLRAAKRAARASNSSCGGVGFAEGFAGSFLLPFCSSSSVGGSSGSFGVRTPAFLASADIDAASGMGDSRVSSFSGSCERMRHLWD